MKKNKPGIFNIKNLGKRDLDDIGTIKKYIHVLENHELSNAYQLIFLYQRLGILTNNNKNYYNILLKTAKLQLLVGNYDSALNSLLEIKDNYSKINDSLVYKTNIELGTLYKNLENYYESKTYYNQALTHSTDAYNLLINLEIIHKQYDEAFETLHYSNLSIEDTLLNEMYINIKSSEYDKALYLNNQLILLEKDNYKKALLIKINCFLTNALGLEFNYKGIDNLALFKQINNFSQSDSLEHILEHLNPNSKKTHHSTFSEDFNIVDFLEKEKNNIKYLLPYKFDIVDKYILTSDDIVGYTEGIATNKLLLVTIVNQPNKLLTAYPTLSHYTETKKKLKHKK